MSDDMPWLIPPKIVSGELVLGKVSNYQVSKVDCCQKNSKNNVLGWILLIHPPKALETTISDSQLF